MHIHQKLRQGEGQGGSGFWVKLRVSVRLGPGVSLRLEAELVKGCACAIREGRKPRMLFIVN